MSREVERYYDETAEAEWQRLERHPIEFRATMRAMEEFIPAASKILDVGGGPGRYAIELARRGHSVSLVDLSYQNIMLAREKTAQAEITLDRYVHANALDLSEFGDNQFEVVLCLGPLYHLLEETERDRAITECKRVLKTGGLIFAAYISRYAFLIDILGRDPAEIKDSMTSEDLLLHGINLPKEDSPGFTKAYFEHPLNIEPKMEQMGFSKLRLAALEAFLAPFEQKVAALEKPLYEKWLDISYRFAQDPISWGTAEHMLYVGRKI